MKRFVERGFNVVANSRKVTQSTEVAASNHVALVDGDIGEPATAARIVETAMSRFGGAKQSGIGVEMGRGGLEEFTQSTIINVAK